MLEPGRRTKSVARGGHDRPSFVYSELAEDTFKGWSLCVWGPGQSNPKASEAEAFVAEALGVGKGRSTGKTAAQKKAAKLAARKVQLEAELAALDE